MKKLPIGFALLLAFAGCTGLGVPQPLQSRPWTLLHGGDQLADSDGKVWIKGKQSNEVLSILGQPQRIETIERNVAEDWYYVYYKAYKTRPVTEEGVFVVRFYNERAIDVAKA
jgi:hypothetical protein